MKNIITILLVLILPIVAYFIIENNSKESQAIASNSPTVMIFSSAMCIDCQKLKLVVEDLEKIYAGKVNFIKYNALDSDKKIKDYIKKYSINLAPTTIILDKDGNQKDKIEGYITKEEFIKEIEEAINE